MPTLTTTIRVSVDLIEQYDVQAAHAGRSRDDLIAEALQQYLTAVLDDVRLTQKAIAEADRGDLIDAEVVDEEMAAWLEEHGVSRERQAAIGARIEAESDKLPVSTA